jgi:hypothetical protein
MYARNTVFVLGAGASVHYGYPTGEQLIGAIEKKARELRNWCEQSRQHHSLETLAWESERDGANGNRAHEIEERWTRRANICEAFAKRLRVARPLVVDYFLGLNSDLHDLGRLLIAWVILECETRPPTHDAPHLDWLRFVRHQLTDGCGKSSDLIGNKVSFLTFNYDVSLELTLNNGLSANSHFDRSDVDDFFKAGRITHVYGRVRDPVDARRIDFETLKRMRSIDHAAREAIDEVYRLSKGIRVIDPNDKGADERALEFARNQVANAAIVYILGFGFDKNNIVRIGLDGVTRNGRKRVLMTNFQNHGRINKRADRLLFSGASIFARDRNAEIAVHDQLIVEKSAKSVYEALAIDFEEIDED